MSGYYLLQCTVIKHNEISFSVTQLTTVYFSCNSSRKCINQHSKQNDKKLWQFLSLFSEKTWWNWYILYCTDADTCCKYITRMVSIFKHLVDMNLLWQIVWTQWRETWRFICGSDLSHLLNVDNISCRALLLWNTQNAGRTGRIDELKCCL